MHTKTIWRLLEIKKRINFLKLSKRPGISLLTLLCKGANRQQSIARIISSHWTDFTKIANRFEIHYTNKQKSEGLREYFFLVDTICSSYSQMKIFLSFRVLIFCWKKRSYESGLTETLTPSGKAIVTLILQPPIHCCKIRLFVFPLIVVWNFFMYSRLNVLLATIRCRLKLQKQNYWTMLRPLNFF